tara:strand:+ start:711 stop:1361 length:651 start_codon:yes stop_codon:yes gene_type:complete
MKIFIGHDSKYPQATDVCIKSIRDNGFKGDIQILDKKKLIRDGVYSREDVEGESTEFSFTRFYVPLLSDYKGISMFCDNDFLWKCNPEELLDYMDNHKLGVVMHDDYEATGTKMDGIVNKTYPRKNWSSLMVFKNEGFKDILVKEYLDNASPAELHQIKWACNKCVSSIPKKYNCLVGHYDCTNAKALHYTNGGPWFDKYKNSEKSLEWWKVYESL